MKTIAGASLSPSTTMVPITTIVSAMLIQKFCGWRRAFSASVSVRVGTTPSAAPLSSPSRRSSRLPSHHATVKMKTSPIAWIGTSGLKISGIGSFSEAEARIIGPVHGRKLTPAANEAAQARMRLSRPSRS